MNPSGPTGGGYRLALDRLGPHLWGLPKNELAVPPKAAETIRLILRDATPRSAEAASTTGTGVPARPDEVPVPRVPWFILTGILGLPDRGPWEKTAFEIDFDFRGVPVTLAHRKCGLRLEVWGADSEQAEALARAFFARLRKAIAVLDKQVLLPVAATQLAAGRVTVGNKYHQLRGHYGYFREVVEACLAGEGRWMADGRASGRLFPREQEAFINFTAAVHAYFSWLEHALVLVLPFAGFDRTHDDLRAVIGASWREKFKQVFDVATDQHANRVLSRLIELSERTRNTWSHGAFDKEEGLLYVHLPSIGATPMRVSDYSKNVHFAGLMGVHVDFPGSWRLLDEIDAFLNASPVSRHGMRYAEAGLQVVFDSRSRRRYSEAMQSDEEFERFIERESEREDRVHNMDW